MKSFRFILSMFVVATCALFLTACPGPKPEADKLSVSTDELEFAADDAEEQIVDVITNVKTWKTSTSDKWISIDEDDDYFAVSVDKNTSTASDRTGTITVKAGEADPVTVTVYQAKAKVNTLSVSPASLSYTASETGNKPVTITTDAASWTATKTASWFTIGQQGSTLTVTVSTANTGTSAREDNITITAGNAPTVTVKVTQAAPNPNPDTYTVYGKMDGLYFGDLIGTKTALFALDMYNAADENIGCQIMGFCALPTNFASFKLTTGTYTLATTGASKTFLTGSIEEKTLMGTAVYNFTTQKFTMITGGTFDVALSGSTYTITTNFTGKDYATNATVSNIRLKYTGTISFTNVSSASQVKSNAVIEAGSSWESLLFGSLKNYMNQTNEKSGISKMPVKIIN